MVKQCAFCGFEQCVRAQKNYSQARQPNSIRDTLLDVQIISNVAIFRTHDYLKTVNDGMFIKKHQSVNRHVVCNLSLEKSSNSNRYTAVWQDSFTLQHQGM
jgi:hypothetical protein